MKQVSAVRGEKKFGFGILRIYKNDKKDAEYSFKGVLWFWKSQIDLKSSQVFSGFLRFIRCPTDREYFFPVFTPNFMTAPQHFELYLITSTATALKIVVLCNVLLVAQQILWPVSQSYLFKKESRRFVIHIL